MSTCIHWIFLIDSIQIIINYLFVILSVSHIAECMLKQSNLFNSMFNYIIIAIKYRNM